MANNCKNSNPLSRGGSSQADRYLSALNPRSAPIDERTLSDFLLFARRYAKHIQYYNLQNQASGNWESFWKSDVSVVLAQLIALKQSTFQQFWSSLRNFILDFPNNDQLGNNEDALKRHALLIFYLPIGLLYEITQNLYLIPSTHPLRRSVTTQLESEIREPLERLLRYYKAATEIDMFPAEGIGVTNFGSSGNLSLINYMQEWLKNIPIIEQATIRLPYTTLSWDEYLGTQSEDMRPFKEGNSTYSRLFEALNYRLFTASVERIIQLAAKIGQQAEGYLSTSLENDPTHAPHYGLWLAFLKLFRYQQQAINKFTGRHLNYYFSEVLQVSPLSPQADRAHLLFQLVKNAESQLLPQGTRFNAGRDANGKEVQYQLLSDLVVNQAQVSDLKSVYLPKTSFPIAAPAIDTLDGIETPLPEESPTFEAFFKGSNAPPAKVGFAVADSLLVAQEGERTIDIIVTTKFQLPQPNFTVYYTSEAGWMPIRLQQGSTDSRDFASMYLSQINEWTIRLKLSAEAPPILPFDPTIHVDDEHTILFPTDQPVIKFELASEYQRWQKVEFTDCRIEMGVKGVKSLAVEHSAGVADTSKPFPLFGPLPGKLPYAIIGNGEVFNKPLQELKLFLEWQDTYNKSEYFFKNIARDYDLKVEYLQGGKWQGESVASQSRHLFTEDESSHAVDISPIVRQQETFGRVQVDSSLYTQQSTSGFIRLELDRSFGHDRYPAELSRAMVMLATKEPYSPSYINNVGGIPKEPYPAILRSLSANYKTKRKPPQQFFHIHPFGYSLESKPTRFLPLIADRGNLYIGLDNLQPPQRLTLLFQVAEGTADPLTDPAEVHWSYLRGNEWISSRFEVDDKTDQLSRSGIIGFNIPRDADTDHTILPSGKYWIRFSVRKRTEAINELRMIATQAGLVELIKDEIDPSWLKAPVPAGTINKLQTGITAIKEVRQPFPSFGGREAETDKRYRLRVSERLRHKNRAVQIWDYEHLILDRFPHIYKVKCLNHTELDNGLQPGHVTIVCVPKIQSNIRNPLRPYTKKQDLLDICRFLRTRTSPFVQIKVVQPQFEAVQLSVSVAFKKSVGDVLFYRQKLNEAIIRFLSPWAFVDDSDINFGGKWHKADMIKFIDQQPYVDFIGELYLFHKTDIAQPDTQWQKIDFEIVQASTDRSILISHPNHLITSLDRDRVGRHATDEDCISEEYQTKPCR